jgi:hypothetical protein
VNIVEDVDKVVPQADKISMKYLGTLDHPIAKMITDSSKKGLWQNAAMILFFTMVNRKNQLRLSLYRFENQNKLLSGL